MTTIFLNHVFHFAFVYNLFHMIYYFM
ncbi:hypothetical protein KUCAC02_016247 [Chaenocephalus aceratus]|uniref:Uncharacterized protein n=1 Tax=Chaenocephalus aceratus TaxID=36190 RepID=A0ACB9Y1J9_CHAAC|nr:hypothetical protein KUCAC02_016247 [Chaenocephalus aceratus]